MELLVPIKYNYLFTINLLVKFVRDIKLILPGTSFNKIDVWLNEVFNFEDDELKAKNIILFALDNMEIIKKGNCFSIQVNKNVSYNDTDIKLITLIKMINYGELNVKGVPIFIKEFEKLNTQLIKLYDIYNTIGVV